GSVVVQPIPISQIRVDLEQPRKIMPRVLREKWDGTQTNLPHLLNQWIQMAGIDVKQAKSLAMGRTNIDDLIEDTPSNHHLRRIFSLAASIFSEGQRTAVELRELPEGGYMIVSGERRWTAINFLVHFLNDDKYATVLAKVEDMDEWTATKAQSIENNQREELTASGKARQFGRLLKTSRETFADDDYKDMSDCDSEYDFYLQFADGRENRIPQDMMPEFESAMGMSGRTMRYYRALFAPFGEYELDCQLWNLMDDNMWAEGFMRDIYTHLSVTQVKELLNFGTTVPKLEQSLRDAINEAKRKKKQSAPTSDPVGTPSMASAGIGNDDTSGASDKQKREEQRAALKYVKKYLTDPAGTRVWCYDITADNELMVSYPNGNQVNYRVTQVTLSNDQTSTLKARPTADGGVTNPRVSRSDVREGSIVADGNGQRYEVIRFLVGADTLRVKTIPQGKLKNINFSDITFVKKDTPDDTQPETGTSENGGATNSSSSSQLYIDAVFEDGNRVRLTQDVESGFDVIEAGAIGTVGTDEGQPYVRFDGRKFMTKTVTVSDEQHNILVFVELVTEPDNTPEGGWLGQLVETPNGTRGKVIGWHGKNLNVQTANGTQEYIPTSLTVIEAEEEVEPEPEPHITDTLFFEAAPETEDAMLFGLLHTFIASYPNLEEEMKVLSEVGLLTMEEGQILNES
ncbi:MAG: ParB N-terminal domain-containing protein, partial [Chloroflexota bacterium]